jgi:hypothetical protein
MGKLKILHSKVGNPDLKHWAETKTFTLAEAAMLTIGADPLDMRPNQPWNWIDHLREFSPNWKDALMISRAMKEAICDGSMVAIKISVEWENERYSQYVNQESLDLHDWRWIVDTETSITRKALMDWYKKNDYLEQNKHRELQPSATTVLLEQQYLLPRRTYTTPPLEVVDELVTKWKTYNPEDPYAIPPSQDVTYPIIKDLLKEKTGEEPSQRTIEAVDIVTRHPKARLGGNKKTRKTQPKE